MKKLIVAMMIFISGYVLAYSFPITDPYSATIIGSSTLMTPNIRERIPSRVTHLL